MSETQELVLKRLAGIIGETKDNDHGLQTRLADIEQQLQALAASITATPKKRQSGDDSDDPWPKRKSNGNSEDVGALVSAAIKEAIAPISEEMAAYKQDREASKVTDAQRQSYNIAAQQYPDLKDANSELSKIADKLFQSRPDLAALPDAPMVISSMAKGILADTRAVTKEVTQQKRDAAVTKPNASGNLDINQLSEDRDRVTQAKELKEKLIEKSQAEGSSTEDLADLFRLNLEQIRGEGQAD
jgi:hypothetical protein